MKIENPNFNYNMPVFKAKAQVSIPALKNLRGVCCVYCGNVTLVHDQIQEFAKHASELKDRKLSRYFYPMNLYDDAVMITSSS